MNAICNVHMFLFYLGERLLVICILTGLSTIQDWIFNRIVWRWTNIIVISYFEFA